MSPRWYKIGQPSNRTVDLYKSREDADRSMISLGNLPYQPVFFRLVTGQLNAEINRFSV